MIILSFLQIIFITLIILLIFTQTVTVKISKADAFVLEVNFTFFALNFKWHKKSGKKKTKGIALSKKIVDTALAIRVIAFAFSRSHVVLYSLEIFKADNDSEKRFLINGLLEIPRSAILAYLRQVSGSFHCADSGYVTDAPIVATVHTSLFHLIRTIVFYFKERLKLKHKAR